MNNQWTFNTKLTHKVNYITIIIITFVMASSTMANPELNNNILNIIPFGIVLVISSLVYFLPMKDVPKAISFSLVIILSNFSSLLTTDFTPVTLASDTLVLVAGIIVPILYFNKELLFISAFTVDICLLVIFILNPTSLFGEEYILLNFINLFAIFNGIMILLYFVTTWGYNMINSSRKSAEESKKLVLQLNALLSNIRENSNSLDSNTNILKDDITTIN